MSTVQTTSASRSLAHESSFTFVLIKPTHYDDDGYPIQWFRSALPSNTLACMNSLAEDARRREVLGPGVDLSIETYDETNRRAGPDHPRPAASRRPGARRHRRSAIEPVSSRRRHRPGVSRGRGAGVHRRI